MALQHTAYLMPGKKKEKIETPFLILFTFLSASKHGQNLIEMKSWNNKMLLQMKMCRLCKVGTSTHLHAQTTAKARHIRLLVPHRLKFKDYAPNFVDKLAMLSVY